MARRRILRKRVWTTSAVAGSPFRSKSMRAAEEGNRAISSSCTQNAGEAGVMIFDPFLQFTPPDFDFRIAESAEELRGYWALRRAIFCEEQQIFQGSDCD